MNRAQLAMRNNVGVQRRIRNWENQYLGAFNAVKCQPLAICGFMPGEGGSVHSVFNARLAPVSGYMRSNAYMELVQVFVPYQAIEKMWKDTQDDAGVTEMTRRRLEAGDVIGLEPVNDITKAAHIHGILSDDQIKIQMSARLAYNCAVNHLRKVAYYDAATVDKTSNVILPAILTANALQRFDGVLDPEKHIDGAINLTGELPVKGIGTNTYGVGFEDVGVGHNLRETGQAPDKTESGKFKIVGDTHNADAIFLAEDPNNPGWPKVFVDLKGTSEISLRDMIESQKLDGLIRDFARIRDADPINGEHAIARALYNLKVDYDANCQVMYRKMHELTPSHHRPTDGASINDVSAHFALNTDFATVVPTAELGGQLVTLAMLKPLEVNARQPDPIQTRSWDLTNKILDHTQLDEELVTRRQLETNVAAEDADTEAFWTAYNRLYHDYQTRGLNDHLGGVERKSTMWFYQIPSAVTPTNVSYPAEGINMYPFYNWNGAHVDFGFSQVAAISTDRALGPHPVEKIQFFADNPELIEGEEA